jgi:hypothetical protein
MMNSRKWACTRWLAALESAAGKGDEQHFAETIFKSVYEGARSLEDHGEDESPSPTIPFPAN